MSEKRTRMIVNGDTKECTKCHEEKLIRDFYWQSAHDNPMSWCKECWKQRQREDYKVNPKRKEYLYKHGVKLREESDYDRRLANLSREEWDKRLVGKYDKRSEKWKAWYRRQKREGKL